MVLAFGLLSGRSFSSRSPLFCFSSMAFLLMTKKKAAQIVLALQSSRKHMSKYILVHGSWHAGWYFQPLASLLEKKGLKEILYHDCSEEIQNWAIPHLQDQPVAPLLEP